MTETLTRNGITMVEFQQQDRLRDMMMEPGWLSTALEG